MRSAGRASTTGPFVVDASVSAAWFLTEEATPSTDAALEATTAGAVWVPALWTLEIADLLIKAHRRRRISAEKRRELASAAAAIAVKVDREPVSISVIEELAGRHGLSAYDAAYLELALRRGFPLATQDEALAAAMAASGVAPARLT